MYWNLTATVAPPCGHAAHEVDLQTHFMGSVGSCMGYYHVGEQIPELEGFTGDIPRDDWLIGKCSICGTWFVVPAHCVDGRVESLGGPVPDVVPV